MLGSASYINNIKVDKTTGIVADDLILFLNLDKIKEKKNITVFILNMIYVYKIIVVKL